MTKVLLVEDDLALSDVLVFTLRRAGFEVSPVYDGEAALLAWETQAPDLLVLDLNLPKLDGMSVCRRIRTATGPQAAIPIIILSVRSADDAIVTGLEIGADDYVVKPFSPTQLVARIRAVLRRANVPAVAGNLSVSGLHLERSRSQVQVGSAEPVRLTPLEVKLLETLMIHAGQVMTVDLLINAVWGQDQGDRAMLKQLVYRLRSKLEHVASNPIPIETIPGVGYVLNLEATPG
jgi:DNA-binding response OmpR family regulator